MCETTYQVYILHMYTYIYMLPSMLNDDWIISHVYIFLKLVISFVHYRNFCLYIYVQIYRYVQNVCVHICMFRTASYITSRSACYLVSQFCNIAKYRHDTCYVTHHDAYCCAFDMCWLNIKFHVTLSVPLCAVSHTILHILYYRRM